MLSAIFIMACVVPLPRSKRKHLRVLVWARVLPRFALRVALFVGVCLWFGPELAHADRARPRPAASLKSAKKTQKKPVDSAALRRAQRLGLGTRPVAGQLLAGRLEKAWVRAAGGDTLPGTLRLPVGHGWFVRGFGSGKGGYHQAIDIGGEVGWNVRAAAPGLVGYAGDEVNGYGNLVILIHPGGFITIYGHNSKNRVVAGQRVERGAVIAELGSTGRSKGPHVHFELLFAGENCDPAPLLRPMLRHKNKRPMQTEKASWVKPQKRPRAITCHPRKHHPDYVDRQEPEVLDDEPEDSPAEAP